MALFTNTYSGLITGGLGLPACCGLLTMDYHLFRCTISPTPPPSGGGGGPYPVNKHINYHTPRRGKKEKHIKITVNMHNGHKWTKQYLVDPKTADSTVYVTDVVDIIRNKISLNVRTIIPQKKVTITSITKD